MPLLTASTFSTPAPEAGTARRTAARWFVAWLFACGAHGARATDGYFDAAWAGGGRIAFDGDVAHPGDSYAGLVALDSGGNLLVLGTVFAGADTYAWLGELQPNGQFLPSFGAANGSGRIDACNEYSPNLCGNDYANAVAIQPDGRYVVATTHHVFRTTAKALALDTLEGNGFQVNDAGGYVNATSALAIQPGGKILAAGFGEYSGAATNQVFGVARLNADMSLDASFGAMKDAQQTTFAGGALPVVSANDSFEIANTILLQPSGRIVLTGYGSASGGSMFYIETAGLTANGLLDASYGDSGAARLSWSYGAVYNVGSAAMDASGRILIASTGVTSAFGIQGMLVLRLSADGSVDASFGDAVAGPGFSFNSNSQCTNLYGSGVALDSAGRILVSGTCASASGASAFAVERLRGDGTLDSSFGANGFSFGAYVTGNTTNVAHSLALDSGGQPIVAGTTGTGSLESAGVARLTYDLVFTSGFESAPRGCLAPNCN